NNTRLDDKVDQAVRSHLLFASNLKVSSLNSECWEFLGKCDSLVVLLFSKTSGEREFFTLVLRNSHESLDGPMELATILFNSVRDLPGEVWKLQKWRVTGCSCLNEGLVDMLRRQNRFNVSVRKGNRKETLVELHSDRCDL